MAMERLRQQIMQQDPSGVYRVQPSNIITSTAQNTTSSQSPTALAPGGLMTPTTWTLGTSEASAADHYGHPDKWAVGSIFASRKACNDAKVHRNNMKGIVGNVREGAFSIVVNEGYEDDIDEGDVIWYTGAGGQDNRFGESQPQKTDQDFSHPDNRALQKNTHTRHPVRVVRGSNLKHSKWGPHRGYRYDGLYDVVHAEYAKGKSGFRICRFKLQRRPGQTALKDLPRA